MSESRLVLGAVRKTAKNVPELVSEREMFHMKDVDVIKHILCLITISKYRAVYEIMCKNVIDSSRCPYKYYTAHRRCDSIRNS